MTADEIDSDILHRHFVAIATSTYDDLGLRPLPEVRDEVRTLAGWFCDRKLGGRRFKHQYPKLADNPTEKQILAALKKPRPGRRWKHTDAAVVYITGHGFREHEEHWLSLRETGTDEPFSTALRTAEIIGWLTETGIEHLLLIIDTCYASYVAGSVAKLRKPLPKTWLVLASAAQDEEAMPGALTDAIQQVLGGLDMPTGQNFGTGEYLLVQDFIDEVGKKLGGQQRLVPIQGSQSTGPHVCLPNSNYQPPDTVPTHSSRSDLALPKKDMEIHWEPRSRGATKLPAPGWLFTGRAALMRQLKAATEEPGTVLVTGRAGSGKSAALSRLVTLSDPKFRRKHTDQLELIPDELKPLEGAVDVAVLATGKGPTEIMTQVCRATGALDQATDPSLSLELVWDGWLGRGTRPVTIVIDALDEANGSPEDLVQVLQGLEGQEPGTRGRVRLIVGVRSADTRDRSASAPTTGIGKQLADLVQEGLRIEAARRIQVDEAPWWVRHDVVDYVDGLLRLSPDSPYHEAEPAAVKAVTEIVADEAGRSFLFAKMAAEQLADRDAVVNINDRAWRASISQDVLGLFREDLRHTLPDTNDRLRAVHLLRAVTFAFGPGLPWRNIWPLVATAVADDQRHYGDSDIVWLLGTRLGGYLVTDRADDVTVYRLFHDDLRKILYEHWAELLEPPPA
jgi:Caspase domain